MFCAHPALEQWLLLKYFLLRRIHLEHSPNGHAHQYHSIYPAGWKNMSLHLTLHGLDLLLRSVQDQKTHSVTRVLLCLASCLASCPSECCLCRVKVCLLFCFVCFVLKVCLLFCFVLLEHLVVQLCLFCLFCLFVLYQVVLYQARY